MKENLLAMMNDLDDEIIMSASKSKKASANPFKKIKWTVVAAAIALFAAIPAAAYALGFTAFLNENQSAWEAYSFERFAVTEYSEDIQSLNESVRKSFLTLDEAKSFFGIDLPKNSIIETSEAKFIANETAENEMEVIFAETDAADGNVLEHACVYVGIDDGKLLAAHIFSFYKTENSHVEITYSAVCEENPYENGGGFAVELKNNEKSESYISENEREFIIVTQKGNDFYEKTAFTEINGLLVTVDVIGVDEEKIEADLFEIIEAYK